MACKDLKIISVIMLISFMVFMPKGFFANKISEYDVALQDRVLEPIESGEYHYSYRIIAPSLVYYSSYILHPILKMENALSYMSFFWKFMINGIAAVLLFFFCRKWYDDNQSFIMTALFLVLLRVGPMYFIYDSLNVLFFMIGFYVIRDVPKWLPLVIIIGTLNKEITVFLVVFYFFQTYNIFGSILNGGVWAGTYYILRKVLVHSSRWIERGNMYNYIVEYCLKYNLTHVISLIGYVTLFFSMIIYGKNLDKLPKFIRKGYFPCFLYILFHLVMSFGRDPRLYYPLLPFMLPAILVTFSGLDMKTRKTEEQR